MFQQHVLKEAIVQLQHQLVQPADQQQIVVKQQVELVKQVVMLTVQIQLEYQHGQQHHGQIIQ